MDTKIVKMLSCRERLPLLKQHKVLRSRDMLCILLLYNLKIYNTSVMYLHYASFVDSLTLFRSSPPEVFLGKSVLKICSKFTGEHTCRSVISAWVFYCKFAAFFLEQLFIRKPLEICFCLLEKV